MAAIKCPKCQLINSENAKVCRRCKTRLSLKTKGGIPNSKTPGFIHAAGFWVIPVIAIVLVSCLYGYKYRKSASDAGTRPTATPMRIERSVPVNRELEEVKKLHRDFIARLDQNMADHTGKSFDENQTLALHSMTQLKELQDRFTDPAAQEYFYRFYGLVETYYDQLVRYSSTSAHMDEVRERSRTECDLILKDPSLNQTRRSSKLAMLMNQKNSESQAAIISADDIDETVQSLHNLSSADSVN
jgi:hypothetical protein